MASFAVCVDASFISRRKASWNQPLIIFLCEKCQTLLVKVIMDPFIFVLCANWHSTKTWPPECFCCVVFVAYHLHSKLLNPISYLSIVKAVSAVWYGSLPKMIDMSLSEQKKQYVKWLRLVAFLKGRFSMVFAFVMFFPLSSLPQGIRCIK